MVELTGDIIERVEVERRLESSSVVVEHYYPYTVARDVKWKLYLVGSVLRAPMKIVTLFLAPSRRTHYKDWGTENFQYNLLTTLGTVVPGILPEPADYGLSLGFSEQPLTRRVRGPWNEVDKSRVVKTIPFSASNMVLRLSDDHRFKTDVLGRFSFAVPAEEWASRKDLIELRLELELEPRKIQASLVLIDPKEIQ